ncbi:MAG: GGDEF domain-containing protein [Actinomycetia bacterium]|nr:GGDEF domain-containing protein [Actinomycetes bacterium]
MQLTVRPSPGRASLPARALGLACCAGGSLCLLSAAYPYSTESATMLALMVGSAGVLAGIILLYAAARTPAIALHITLAATSIFIACFIARATTIEEQLLTTIGFIWVGVYVACFFGRLTTFAHIVFMAGCYVVALVVSPIEPSVLVATVMMATVSALSAMTNLLVFKMRQLADLDPLTGLLRRGAFMTYAQDDLDNAGRRNTTSSLAMLDLDGFKQINDTVGHSAGDALLTRLSQAWAENVRDGDLLGRYGGDEFALYMPDTSLDEAYAVVRRLDQVHPEVTWSVGVTEWHGDTLDAWLERTDKALYDDKRVRRGEAAS